MGSTRPVSYRRQARDGQPVSDSSVAAASTSTFVLVWDASVQHCDARGSPSKLTYVAADTPDRALCFDGTQGAAVCQSCSSDYNCGLTSTAVWSLLNTLNPCSGLVYTVTGGTRARTSIISLTCDSMDGVTSFQVFESRLKLCTVLGKILSAAPPKTYKCRS